VIPRSYDGEALNTAPDSENRIHSDDVARQYGFEGGLVPGVTVSAYALQPAVDAWGMDWLTRGRGIVVVKKPLYDQRAFRVEVRSADDAHYEAELIDSTGTLCATVSASLPADAGPGPTRRGDGSVVDRVPATREGVEQLRERGMGAMKAIWDEGVPMTAYTRDPSKMPELLSMDAGAFANSSFLLGLTNWVFAANVALGPWVHLEAKFQHYAPVPKGSELIVEARVVDLFGKKGHEFVDVDVAAFLSNDAPILSARLRAIYKLRDTSR
jgi:hypothetical protein